MTTNQYTNSENSTNQPKSSTENRPIRFSLIPDDVAFVLANMPDGERRSMLNTIDDEWDMEIRNELVDAATEASNITMNNMEFNRRENVTEEEKQQFNEKGFRSYWKVLRKVMNAISTSVTREFVSRTGSISGCTEKYIQSPYIILCYCLYEISQHGPYYPYNQLSEQCYEFSENTKLRDKINKTMHTWKLFFVPALFAALWFCLIWFYRSPLLGEFLSMPSLEYWFTGAVIVVFIALTLFFLLCRFGFWESLLGSILVIGVYMIIISGIIGPILSKHISFISNVITIDNAALEYQYILTPIIILLLLSILLVPSAIRNNIGKRKKLLSVQKKIDRAIPIIKMERDHYCALLEVLPQLNVNEDDVTRMTEVKRFLESICQKYDRCIAEFEQ